MGDKETRLGAENRVKNVMEKMKEKLPDFVVGLEGGVEKVGSTLHCMAWYVVPIQHSLTHTRTHTQESEALGRRACVWSDSTLSKGKAGLSTARSKGIAHRRQLGSDRAVAHAGSWLFLTA